MAALYVIERTRVGSLVRASVVDPQMVSALGVDTKRLVTGVFAVGAALAAAGGVIGGPILSAYPGLDNRILLLGLVVVVIGGLGSVSGALVGALVIGQIETLASRSCRTRVLPRLRRDGPGPAPATPGPARHQGGGGMRDKLPALLAVIVVLLLAAVPLIFPADTANTLSRVLALALLAVSLDLLVGVSGMPRSGTRPPSRRCLHGRARGP